MGKYVYIIEMYIRIEKSHICKIMLDLYVWYECTWSNECCDKDNTRLARLVSSFLFQIKITWLMHSNNIFWSIESTEHVDYYSIQFK